MHILFDNDDAYAIHQLAVQLPPFFTFAFPIVASPKQIGHFRR